MSVAKTFLTAFALSAGIAIPLFIGAQVATEASAQEARERVERGIEQLRSESPVVRDAAAEVLAKESKEALPALREQQAKARDAGEVDLANRLGEIVSKVEEKEGLTQKPAVQEKSDREQPGNTFRVQLGNRGNAVKSTTFIENGRVTTIQKDAEGKLTVKISGGGQAGTEETFDTEEAFAQKHPDLAKRFSDDPVRQWRFQSPFERQQDGDTPSADPFEDLFQPFPQFRVLRQIPESELDGIRKHTESANSKLEATRLEGERLGEQGKAVLDRLKEAEDEVAKIRAELDRIAPKREQTERAQRQVPADPFDRLRQMMEQMQKEQEERLRKMQENPGDLFEQFRRMNGGEQPEAPGSGEGVPSGTPEEPKQEKLPDAPLPEKPKGADDDF